MSFILTLNEENLSSIIELLPKFEKLIACAEPIFNLDGLRLEQVMKTVPQYQHSYDSAYQELKALEEWLNGIKEKRMAKVWKKYLEGYQRALSTKDIQVYAAGESSIVEINQIVIEISLLKNQMLSIVEALKNLGWMVGHITKLRVAEMQEAIL